MQGRHGCIEECLLRRYDITLGIEYQKRDLRLTAGGDKIQLAIIQNVTRNQNNCKIGAVQFLKCFIHSESSQRSRVVDAGGIDPYHRSYPTEFHGFADRISGGARRFRDYGNLLTGEEVDERALAVVAASEDADMRFQFIAFHTKKTFKEDAKIHEKSDVAK